MDNKEIITNLMNQTEDAEELGVPGLAQTVLTLECKVAKFEKQAKAKDTRLNNIMKRLIFLEGRK